VRVRIGPAIAVPAEKGASPDPLTGALREELEAMIADMGQGAPLAPGTGWGA
jgi:hypothetical protein